METNKIGKEAIISQVPIPIEEYNELLPYLKVKSYSKNQILKACHEVETTRRYLISGTLALFENQEDTKVCRRIYSKHCLVCDFESFEKGQLTDFSIVAYTDCLVCEIPKELEAAILIPAPHIIKLILRLSHQVLVQNLEWTSVLWLSPKARYSRLPQICPDFALIKIKDICGILNLPERTLQRLRKKT